MRKHVKRKFLGFIDELVEVNRTILELVSVINREAIEQQLSEILADAQKTAIIIGTEIEKIEGNGTDAVKGLEMYCELLWEISQMCEASIPQETAMQAERVLQFVKDGINKLPEQYEVIFLPYKVSMWDCMESVWMAANEDPDCFVKVIPIPYYDRNSEGRLSELHYEGMDMPEYVEITHYNDYNIEEMHPDIVYIHNPYDAGNYVTCVHPKFFSSELKKSTDMLVYIPYFMSGIGPYPDIHWNLPAYQFVDKIIIQDECKLEGLCRYVPKEKLLVVGSPKVDRIARLETERLKIKEEVIPKEWRDKIQGKKVFLYNVSLSGVLKNSGTAMDKIRNVLSKFEKRDDVVLLWRPHPLIESTLKAMRPELYRQYEEIKMAFIKADKGIFDETADVGISATISDAYIGEDSSSMIHYFDVVGKHVLYTDWKVREGKGENDRRAMLVTDCFEENGKLYFTPNMPGMEYALYKLDLTTGEIEKEAEMPGEAYGLLADTKYYDINIMNNKVILAGYNSSETYIYDRKKKSAVKIVLPETEIVACFDRTIRYDDKIFLKPKNYPAIVKIDIETYEMTCYRSCVEVFNRMDGEELRFLWAYTVKDNLLYMASAMESKMLIFNMDDGSYNIKDIGKYDFGYFSMVYDGEYFWMAAYGNDCIIRWDEETNETIEISYVQDVKEKVAQAEGVILIDAGEALLAFCMFKNNVFKIMKNGGCVNLCKLLQGKNEVTEFSMNGLMEGFTFVRKISEERVVGFRRQDCSLVVWDLISDEQRLYPVMMSVEDMRQKEQKEIEMHKKRHNSLNVVSDNVVNVEKYIDYIVYAEKEREDIATMLCTSDMKCIAGNCGKNIHYIIKEQCAIIQENVGERK